MVKLPKYEKYPFLIGSYQEKPIFFYHITEEYNVNRYIIENDDVKITSNFLLAVNILTESKLTQFNNVKIGEERENYIKIEPKSLKLMDCCFVHNKELGSINIMNISPLFTTKTIVQSNNETKEVQKIYSLTYNEVMPILSSTFRLNSLTCPIVKKYGLETDKIKCFTNLLSVRGFLYEISSLKENEIVGIL